ncbi:hypothetical protein FS594_28830 (plasmid) [Rahnella aquatilis]|nr:hypothetical protein FS594_28830 [Rahnella aquatilis]
MSFDRQASSWLKVRSIGFRTLKPLLKTVWQDGGLTGGYSGHRPATPGLRRRLATELCETTFVAFMPLGGIPHITKISACFSQNTVSNEVIISNSPDKDLYVTPFGKTLCVISYFQTFPYIEKACEVF